MAMDFELWMKAARGYFFLGRNLLAGKVTNKVLDLLAFLDYRLLMILSMWHPDHAARIKLLRKRGVRISEKAWVDLGVWIEMTTPQHVVIEDYAKIAFGAVIFAHDAAVNSVADLPMRVQETRIGYNSAIGARSIIMPGVTVGEHCGVLPGSVVTKDVPDHTVWGGVPAVQMFTSEELGLAWQADVLAHPEKYYDHPNVARAPSTPFDHLLTWRDSGVKVRDWMELRTGTPFDYIIEFKQRRKERGD
ncbi:MAG: acyltransferase [Actinobacteria bacterium]|nr:acyltransferase [Actinomycetota bacterium]